MLRARMPGGRRRPQRGGRTMNAHGKVALITGANKGLGKETARRLGRLGMTILIGARDSSRGQAAAEELRHLGIGAHAVTMDVTDEETIERARQWIDDT